MPPSLTKKFMKISRGKLFARPLFKEKYAKKRTNSFHTKQNK
jgi:hypothetical protein